MRNILDATKFDKQQANIQLKNLNILKIGKLLKKELINMNNWLKLAVIMLYVGFFNYIEFFIGILDALHEKECYELPLNEFYNNISCKPYRGGK